MIVIRDRQRSRPSIVGAIMFTAIGTGFLLQSLGLWTFSFVYFWPLLLISFGVSELLGRARRVQVERVRSKRLATAEERVRIAQELHDIVAHSVSLMTVQIAAARRVFERQPDEAAKVLEAAEETGRQSLAELRNMLSILRSADRSIEEAGLSDDLTDSPTDPVDRAAETRPLPTVADIPALVESTKGAGLDVTLEMTGDSPRAAQSVELTVYRIVQEALTNAIRYAEGSTVSVKIEQRPSEIELTVTDDGPGDFSGPINGGHGLMGMKERISAVGGSLDVGPLSRGGWRVHAVVPVSRERD